MYHLNHNPGTLLGSEVNLNDFVPFSIRTGGVGNTFGSLKKKVPTTSP